MMRCLFVGKSELDEIPVTIRPSDEAKAGREVVARKSRGYDDGRNKNQKCIQMGRSFLIDKRRIDAVADQSRLVLHGLMYDRVQLVIGHYFEKMGH